MLRPLPLPAPVLSLFLALFLALLAPSASATDQRSLLVFGDSLSTGHGIDGTLSWPALLQQKLKESGHPIRVVNLSRRGETAEGGLRRLGAILEEHRPAWVLLELGANDGLRKRPLGDLKRNLLEMLQLIRANGATPILVGMELPLSYEPQYAMAFSAVFQETARETGTAFVPFLLEKIADRPDLFQADRLHPSAEAQPKLLDVVWPVVDPLLMGP